MATNKVVFGNTTVMDISGDTAQAADVAQGKTFHDRTGTQQTGSYVAPTITSITPSNSDPVPLFVLENYHIIGNDGYAIDRYDSVVPTAQSPNRISAGEIIKVTSIPGYLVSGFTEISPSDETPIPLSSTVVYKPRNNGVAVGSVKARAADDTDPPYLDVGYIYKIQTTGGYLYATQQTSGFPYTKSGTLADFTSANQEQSIDTGLSSITYFWVQGYPVNYQTTNISTTWLDTTRSFSKQIATNSTSSATSVVNSGTNASGVITGTGIQLKISAISGGTVTIKTGNSNAYIHKNVTWYAG